MKQDKIKPMLFSVLKNYDGKKFIKDVVAGIIVAIIALPLSIALALASGVGPEQGIYTQLIGCQPGRIAINRGIQILLLADDVAVEEGHDLAAGAGLREREFGLRGSLGDAVLHGPEDGLIEIVGTIRGRFLD